MGNIDFHPNVTFFVGENGAGKSTVLEGLALALAYSAEGGTRNVRLQTVESVSNLHEVLRLARGVPAPRDGYFLLAYPHARIVLFDASGLAEVAYEDTEHYAVTRDFLNHPGRRLAQLLGEGDSDAS